MKINLNLSAIFNVKQALMIFAISASFSASSQTITTVAGNGTVGFNGDNGQAVLANINAAHGIVFDPAGNMYFSDILNNRVRKVTPAGIITTIAGNGSMFYAGDGVAATTTGLYNPAGLAFDAAGNLYIADQYNYCIRKVNTSGIITTVAGNGSAGYNGDGIPAINATLFNPAGVAFDAAGNLYITDVENSRIRMVDAAGIISTVVGTGALGYSGDNGPATAATLNRGYAITFDASGNMFIADFDNYCIRKVDVAGIITTVAGTGVSGYGGDGGTATTALMQRPYGVDVDGAGNLFIADCDNHRVRKVSTAGTITTYAGTGVSGYNGDNILANTAMLDKPIGVSCDAAGNLYIGDFENKRLRKVTAPCQPGIITSSGSQTVTSGSTTQFSANSTYTPSTYQWQVNQGFGFVNLSNAGQYSGVTTAILNISNISATNNNNLYQCIISGCTSNTSTAASLTVKMLSTGLQTSFKNEAVSIYPNPAMNFIQLQSELIISKIVIKDITSRIMLETLPNEKTMKIDLNNFARGIYFVSCYSGNNLVLEKKLIVGE